MPACGADSILFNSLTGLDRRPFILSQTLRLIRVFDCAEEVAFFYRKFLSRRLLTRRFLSTDMEQSVLDALGVRAHPKMSLFSQMVKDVTRSEHLFSAFKVRRTVCVGVCVCVCVCGGGCPHAPSVMVVLWHVSCFTEALPGWPVQR